jgi:hypothetical protein
LKVILVAHGQQLSKEHIQLPIYLLLAVAVVDTKVLVVAVLAVI